MRPHRDPQARRRRIAAAARPALVALMSAAAAAALAACGSSHTSGTSADPASIVPAGASAYAGATVRPTGAQQQAAQQAGFRLTRRPNPYLRLLLALQTPGSPALEYNRDVAPWLGPHAGVFVTSLRSANALLPIAESLAAGGATATAFPFGASAADGALVLDTRDVARARSFVSSQASRAGAHASAYGGVSYQVSGGGVAFAVIDSFVVIGSEPALHAVIDTTRGGPALVHASTYTQLQAQAPSDSVAHVFATGAAPSAHASGLEGLLAALTGGRAMNASLVPSASTLALSVDMLGPASGGGAPGALGSAAEGATALGELPGESWLALGLGHVGAWIAQDVALLKGIVALGSSGSAAGASALNLGSLLNGLLTPLSLLAANTPQAHHDFASWMGSGGIFASGASLLELKAAVVIESTDPALSRAAVAKLGAQLTQAGGMVSPASIAGTEAAESARIAGLPIQLEIAAGHDSAGHAKFVLGLGEASVAAALNPPSKLAGSAPVAAAATALGEGMQPNLIFQTPTLLALLEGLGLNEDPTLARVLPYIRNSTGVVGGGRELGGGVQRVRLALQLRPG
jgi:hypothetical protein